jgi:hypothetical protein
VFIVGALQSHGLLQRDRERHRLIGAKTFRTGNALPSQSRVRAGRCNGLRHGGSTASIQRLRIDRRLFVDYSTSAPVADESDSAKPRSALVMRRQKHFQLFKVIRACGPGRQPQITRRLLPLKSIVRRPSCSDGNILCNRAISSLSAGDALRRPVFCESECMTTHPRLRISSPSALERFPSIRTVA